MSAIPNYVIHCEGSGCRKVHTPTSRCVRAIEARASAAGAGWARIARNGRQIDACPNCARLIAARPR